MFQKMYADDPDNWQKVDCYDVYLYLSRYYNNVYAIMVDMQNDPTMQIRTPWAFYKFVPDIEPKGQ